MEQVYKFLKEEIQYGDAVVVCVSGGPDSMALLHLVNSLKENLGIYLICAHVNHNVRKESAEEKIFVERFCHQNKICFESMMIEEYGDDNFHNEARTKRYHYFATIVRKYHAKYLLTAHHGDDLMETVLMRLVRGSTLRGYSGFSKIVDMQDYKIMRPFIEITKEEILKYNKKNAISFVQDASNQKDVYTRNRFRKYIVPEIRKEDAKVHQKFYKFSKTLLEYNDYIEKQVEKILKTVFIQQVLQIDAYLKQEHIMQMKIIYHILENIYQDDLMLITDHHAELIDELIHSKKANASIHLPNKIKKIKSYDTVSFSLFEMPVSSYEIELIQYINLPNGKNIEFVKESEDTSNFTCRLSSKEIALPLHVRTKLEGDKMKVKGMLGSKKIKDIFIDEKIPLKEREIHPIVVDSNDTIVWIPGLKKSKFDKQSTEFYDIILKYY